jgi:hypothetical protein
VEKDIFLERLQRERDRFELLLNRAGFKRQMTIRGVARGLSVKDLLADLLAREQFIADRLGDLVHKIPYAPSLTHAAFLDFRVKYGFPDYESPFLKDQGADQLVINKHRAIGLDDLVSQEIAAYSNILSGLGSLTTRQCLEHDLFRRVAEHTYRPYRKIGAAIRRWMEFTTPEP